MKEMKNKMKKAKSLAKFEGKQSLLIGLDTLSLINDWTKQIEYAIDSFTLKKRSDKSKDKAVKKILKNRLSKGFDKDISIEAKNLHKNSNRVEVVNQYILIPINISSHGIKNWHQLVELICSKFPSVIELSDQIHQRSTTANRDFTEVIYWIIKNRLKSLYQCTQKILHIQEFVTGYFNQEALDRINIIGEIANNITKVEKNA